MSNSEAAPQVTPKGSRAEEKDKFFLAQAYVGFLLENTEVLLRVKDFDFADQAKRKSLKSIKIYPTSKGGTQKDKIGKMILEILNEYHIKVSDESDFFNIYVDASSVLVPVWFVQKYNLEKKHLLEDEDKNSVLKDEKPIPGYQSVLSAIELNNVLAFEKSRDENSMTLSVPDTIEKKWATDVLNSFGFETEVCEKYCLKVLMKNVKPKAIVKIPGSEPTDRKRFSEDLAAAIIITRWELSKPNSPVRLIGDLNDHATKSTPFKMEDSNAGRTAANNFAEFMANNYGVVIRLEIKDPYIFRVLSPKDKDYAEAKVEQVERTKKMRSNIHPITKLLIDAGHTCYTATIKTICFTLRLYEGSLKPRKIALIHGSEEEREALIKQIFEVLVSHGHKVKFGSATASIYFLNEKLNTRKDAHPLNNKLFKAGFLTRTSENIKTKEVVFQLKLSDEGMAKGVILSGGLPDVRKKMGAGKDVDVRKKVVVKLFKFLEKIQCNPSWNGKGFYVKIGNDPYFTAKTKEGSVSEKTTASKAVVSDDARKTITAIALTIGVKSWDKEVVKKFICFSRSSVDEKTGWQRVNITTKDEGKIDLIVESKKAFMKKLQDEGYLVKDSPKSTAKSFSVFYGKGNEDLNAENFVPKQEVINVDTAQVEKASNVSGFGNQVISLFVKELTENPELHRRISILFPQEKVDPAETKKLVSDILEKEFVATPVSFEGPAGKFYSDDEIKKFIDRVINDLPS